MIPRGQESLVAAAGWDRYPPGRGITGDDVDIWILRLDLEPPNEALLGALSPDEQLRAARKRSIRDGRRFATGRASLRGILGDYLAEPPAALRFRYETYGRPALDPPTTDLSFSVANAGAVGLVAVARARAVGIDIELSSTAGQIADIADGYLPPGRIAEIRMMSAATWDERWVGLWTEVEATAKYDGCGVGQLDPSRAASLLDLDLHRIQFEPIRGYVGTLVYGGSTAHVSHFAFEPTVRGTVATA